MNNFIKQYKININNILNKSQSKVNNIENYKIYSIKLLDLIYILTLITALVILFENYIILAFLLIIFCTALFAIQKHHKEPKLIDKINDIISFLNSLIREYEINNNLLKSLIDISKNNNFFFSKDLNEAIYQYRLGVEATIAFNQLKYNSFKELNAVANSIEIGLDRGKNILYMLKNIKENLEKKRQQLIKNSGILKNTFSLNKLGNTIFLPIFAGISINIINFSSVSNFSIQSISNISLIFLTYIFIINYINTLNVEKKSDIKEALLYSVIGFFIFMLSKNTINTIW
ncbi:MAG: hypothetical protein ACP5RI_00255 [Candidatus Micrarchaeia archaeon]